MSCDTLPKTPARPGTPEYADVPGSVPGSVPRSVLPRPRRAVPPGGTTAVRTGRPHPGTYDTRGTGTAR